MKKQILSFGFALLTAVSFGQKYGANPEDSLSCLQNSSLYKEFYKQKNYKDAKGPWIQAVALCPTSSKNLYIKGAVMYRKFIVTEKDPAIKALLIDSLMWVYDQRILHFGQKGSVLGRKGVDLARFDKSKYAKVYEILGESFTLEGNKSQKAVITSYYQSAEKMVKNKVLTPVVLFELFPKLSEVVIYNIDHTKDVKKKEKWVKVASVIEQIFSKYAGCPELIEIYTPKYVANPNDTNVLQQIISFMGKSDCTEEDLYLNASMSLDTIKPSALSKFGIGRSLLKRKRFDEAIIYFKLSAELSELEEIKVNSYKYIALTYLSLKEFANAKSYALKMLAVNAENADAFMIIGDAYLYGSRSVGENACEQAGGYWAAIAKYRRAKSLDATLAATANKKIASSKAQWPKKQIVFFIVLLMDNLFT